MNVVEVWSGAVLPYPGRHFETRQGIGSWRGFGVAEPAGLFVQSVNKAVHGGPSQSVGLDSPFPLLGELQVHAGSGHDDRGQEDHHHDNEEGQRYSKASYGMF